MTHWAAHLIGLPWAQDGQGPRAYSCWGLVRHVFAVRHGIDMPIVAVGSDDNAAALAAAARVSGWRPVQGKPQADDIVLMRGPLGRHVGVMVEANGSLGVLHASHETGVVWQPLADATAGGYHDIELWRRA